ncbi:MAG: hypothetical protein P8163_15445 [Candidatus Thiodiazotropha sp.]
MKGRFEPICEAFVYGSPEKILSFTYRRVAATPRRAVKPKKDPIGDSDGCKHRNRT